MHYILGFLKNQSQDSEVCMTMQAIKILDFRLLLLE